MVYRANNIRVIRERLGLSQEEFASRCGISRTSIARYERGEAPSASNAKKIADACSVSIDDIMGAPSPSFEIRGYFRLENGEQALLEAYRALTEDQQIMICRSLGIEHPSSVKKNRA